jgi:hypothetical protein
VAFAGLRDLQYLEPYDRVVIFWRGRRVILEKEADPTGAAMPVSGERKQNAAAKAKESRDERLKSQLRANLQRRKQQARARREGREDDRPGDLAIGDTSRDPE